MYVKILLMNTKLTICGSNVPYSNLEGHKKQPERTEKQIYLQVTENTFWKLHS